MAKISHNYGYKNSIFILVKIESLYRLWHLSATGKILGLILPIGDRLSTPNLVREPILQPPQISFNSSQSSSCEIHMNFSANSYIRHNLNYQIDNFLILF